MSIEQSKKIETLEHDVKNLQQAVSLMSENIKEMARQNEERMALIQELHDLKHKLMAKAKPPAKKKVAADG